MIYLIGAYLDGALYAVKLGHSTDPASRLSSLQTASPLPLRLIATAEGDETREADLHSVLARWRMVGEWFRPVRAIGAVFGVSIDTMAAVPEPPELLALRARVVALQEELVFRNAHDREPTLSGFRLGRDLETAVEQFRRRYVLSAVEDMDGNRSAAARALNCSVRTVFRYTAGTGALAEESVES